MADSNQPIIDAEAKKVVLTIIPKRSSQEAQLKYSLAIDIGASSGRHIVGWRENGEIQTKEVYRFPNGVTELDGHLTWDIAALEGHVKAGIDEALKEYPRIESLSMQAYIESL